MKGPEPARLLERIVELETSRRRIDESQSALNHARFGAVEQAREFWTSVRTLGRTARTENGSEGRSPLPESADPAYAAWRERHEPSPAALAEQIAASGQLAYRPLLSVVMPVYNTKLEHLEHALDSVRAQTYDAWELCIADDASTKPEIARLLEDYAARDPRIRVVRRARNGHISAASNSALEIATGDFVVMFDHDDALPPWALYEVALELNEWPDADMIYGDEDKLDESGARYAPYFKPDWSPDSFLSRMYTCHLAVYRRALAVQLGGFRVGFEGSQDYDFVLRLSELTQKIRHVPKILYHWRCHEGSTAGGAQRKSYATGAAMRALGEALARRGEPGRIEADWRHFGVYRARYDIIRPGRVSVIVPTRDHGDDVDRCLSSLFRRGGWDDLEVILVDNGSTDPASLGTFERWAQTDKRVKVLRIDAPFNFSALNNAAVAAATGIYLLLLNNDTEVRSDGAVRAMLEQAQRPSIGAVGAILVYPDNGIQHAGVIVGLGGVAGHSHKHFPATAPGYFQMLRSINNYSAVTGACLMVRRDAYLEVGGLDESLSVAFNDVDFCLKLRSRGLRNVCLPHVRLLHFESKSRGYETTPEKQLRFTREVDSMVRRWNTLTYADPAYSPNLTRDHENYAINHL